MRLFGGMKRIVRHKRWFGLVACSILIAVVGLLSGVHIEIVDVESGSHSGFGIGSNEEQRFVLVIGPESAHAAPSIDYTCDGVADDVQFQAALNALPVSGGQLFILAGTYDWTNGATVSRAIDNVTIGGVGLATNITGDGVTALFSAGAQSNWSFRNFQTDAGGITVAGATDYILENTQLGATYTGYYFAGDVTLDTGSLLTARTGRSVTLTVAASDSAALDIAQADYVCDGTADEVQIQAAIDALPASGGTVLLFTGTYGIDAHIVLASDTTVIGTGKNSTVLRMDFVGVTYDGLFYWTGAINDVTIAHLEIDGNRAALPDPGGGLLQLYHSGIWGNFASSPTTRLTVYNVYLHDFYGRAINVYLGDDCLVESCLVDTCRDNGIHYGQGLAPASVDEEADVARDNRIMNNTTLNCGASGIQVAGAAGSGGNTRALVFGNYVRDCVSGISIGSATPVTVSNNTVIGGTCALNANGMTIDGNIFYLESWVISCRNSTWTNNRFGGRYGFIQLNNGSDDNIFDGNESYNQFLLVAGGQTCDRIQITNHRHYGDQYLAYIQGDDWKVENNICQRIETATTLAAGASTGDTVLQLADASDAFTGMPIDIIQDDATTLQTFILEVVQTGYVVIYDPLTDDCALGNVVNVNPTTNRGVRIEAGNDNLIANNDFSGVDNVPVLDNATNTIIRFNKGYITENSGTATLLNGQVTIVVNHGCIVAPTLILITFAEDPTNLMADWWVDTVTATQFTFHGVDPGASNLDFYWEAKVR